MCCSGSDMGHFDCCRLALFVQTCVFAMAERVSVRYRSHVGRRCASQHIVIFPSGLTASSKPRAQETYQGLHSQQTRADDANGLLGCAPDICIDACVCQLRVVELFEGNDSDDGRDASAEDCIHISLAWSMSIARRPYNVPSKNMPHREAIFRKSRLRCETNGNGSVSIMKSRSKFANPIQRKSFLWFILTSRITPPSNASCRYPRRASKKHAIRVGQHTSRIPITRTETSVLRRRVDSIEVSTMSLWQRQTRHRV